MIVKMMKIGSTWNLDWSLSMRHLYLDTGEVLEDWFVVQYGFKINAKKGLFPSANSSWYFAWVSRSLRLGLGTNVGWEWYQPTTWYPDLAKRSEASAWDTKIFEKFKKKK